MLLANTHQLDIKYQRRIRRDRPRCALRAVAEIRRDDQRALPPTFMPARP